MVHGVARVRHDLATKLPPTGRQKSVHNTFYLCLYLSQLNTFYLTFVSVTQESDLSGHMDGQHHRLNGHELGQTLGDSKGQGGLACCSPWDCKELDMTQQLNSSNNKGWGDTDHVPEEETFKLRPEG